MRIGLLPKSLRLLVTGLSVVGLLTLGACGDEGRGDASTTTETSSAEATAEPDDPVGESGEPTIDFDAEIDLDANADAFAPTEEGARVQLKDVAGNESGFVAVGEQNNLNEAYATRAAVVFSQDGANWEWIEDDAFGEPARMSAVVGVDGGFVAVGSGASTEDEAAVWTSPDGRDWERLEDPDGVLADADMADVALGEDGLVAVGRHTVEYEDEPSDLFGAIWHSEDGTEWQRYDESELPPLDSEVTSQSFNGVTARAEGFLAGGVENGEPFLWRTDGTGTWEAIESGAFDGGVSIGSVTASGDSVVAVGSVGEQGESVPAIWSSADGEEWELLDVELDADLALFGLDVNDSGLFVAAGPLLDDPGLGDEESDESEDVDLSQVWGSEDGMGWQELEFETEEDAMGTIFGVRVFANGYLGVGYEDASAQVWIEELES